MEAGVYWLIEVGESSPVMYVREAFEDGSFDITADPVIALRFTDLFQAQDVKTKLTMNEFLRIEDHEFVDMEAEIL